MGAGGPIRLTGTTTTRPAPGGHVGGRRRWPRRADGPGSPGPVPRLSREPAPPRRTVPRQRAAEEGIPPEGGPGTRVEKGVRRDARKAFGGGVVQRQPWAPRAGWTQVRARGIDSFARAPAPDLDASRAKRRGSNAPPDGAPPLPENGAFRTGRKKEGADTAQATALGRSCGVSATSNFQPFESCGHGPVYPKRKL